MNLVIHEIKKVEMVFEIQLACVLLTLVSGSKPGYASLNAENSLRVTFDFLDAHEKKKKILVSVLNIFSLFFMTLI